MVQESGVDAIGSHTRHRNSRARRRCIRGKSRLGGRQLWMGANFDQWDGREVFAGGRHSRIQVGEPRLLLCT